MVRIELTKYRFTRYALTSSNKNIINKVDHFSMIHYV
ncbi:hypothetical protein CPT_MarsHill_163 [Staphylococcus phage MarsHill]|nr:hypothetical protein CPT_MarsHill_163 [Staphylococcus phage MarsHill]